MPLADWRQSRFVSNILLRTATFYVLAGVVAWLLRGYAPSTWGVIGGQELSALAELTGAPPSRSAAAAAVERGPAAVQAVAAISKTRIRRGALPAISGVPPHSMLCYS